MSQGQVLQCVIYCKSWNKREQRVWLDFDNVESPVIFLKAGIIKC